MKLVITGAGGFLGRALSRAAVAAGHEVIGIGRSPAPADWPGRRWLTCDLATATPAGWTECRGAAVCHLAAETRLQDEGRDFLRDNLLTTRAACGIAANTGGRLIFVSSSAVYSGPGTQHPASPLTTAAPTEPATPYGRAKREAEQIVRAAGVEAVIFRLFGLLGRGAGSRPGRGSLLQAIEEAAGGGNPVGLKVDEAGRHGVRDWVTVEDACRCLLEALHRPPTESVLNLCTGKGTDNLELVRAAGRAWGREIPFGITGRFGSESPVMVGDPGPLARWLGWVPPVRVTEFWATVASARAAAR